MVDIAGAASGPLLAGRPDPLQTGSQTSQVVTDNVAPEQASGVTAPANINGENEGGSQGSFDNPASGDNLFQAQLAGSEPPLSPIEEVIRDFPPDAVVQQQEQLRDSDTGAGLTAQVQDQGAQDQADTGTGTANAGDAPPPAEGNDFGVTEEQASQQAQVAAAESEQQPVNEESGGNEAPQTNLTGANDNPFGLANGSAGNSGGQPAIQPPGSVVDFAA